LIYEKLVENGLETIEKCKDEIPIVIQSFELDSLIYFKTLTELPTVLVMGVDRSNHNQKINYFIEQLFRVMPGQKGWSLPAIPNWGEVSKIINGISPFHQMMTKPGAHLDPMTDEWDYKTVEDSYTDLCRMLHSVDIAIHPWPMQDDHLSYRKTPYAEQKMFIKNGVDGFFVEFTKDSFRWFTDIGNYSTLDFSHPLHTLESKDLNLEMLKKCIANRYLG